jgi:RNA polymerase sigma-70 factor, ECF subfamily
VTSLQPAAVNGQPGAIFFDPEGHPIGVVSLDIADDQVQAIRAVLNPDKLSHLHGLD